MNVMGNWDIGYFYCEFFFVIYKKGLIIDVCFNVVGYIDVIIFEKLL